MNPLETAGALCDELTDAGMDEPVMPWMWGPALLGHALAELDAYRGQRRYLPWLERYAEHHLRRTPAIHSSDTVAPALVTWALQQRGDERFAPLTGRAVDYIMSAPRAVDDAVNHLGDSGWNWLYPRSVWVDSLMMFAVFPAIYGRATGDSELLDFAARQPAQYADRLLDPETGLWHHSYWVRLRRRYPGAFWGRGNGWVIASLPMILDQLDADHPRRPEILKLLAGTSEALLRLQRDDGTWTTVLADKRRRWPSRPGYRELSATALVASGWLHGVRAGYLPERFRAPGERALSAVTAAVRRRDGRLELPEISGPTIPVPVVPRLGYQWTPTGANHPYGVAAFVFAALNWARLT